MTSPRVFLIAVLTVGFAWGQNPPAKHEPALDVSSMDAGVDPCTDFYTYSCGGWLKKNPIPADQSSWGVYSRLQDENRLVLRDILETAATSATDREAATRKIGDYYAACMDEKAIDAAGVKPVKDELERIERLQSKQQIAGLAAAMVDDDVLFEFRSDQDFKDSSQVIAEVDQGGIGLPDRDFYLLRDAKTKKLRKAYRAHVQKTFELLGDTPHVAGSEAKSVLRIETVLAKGSMGRVDRRDPQKVYHKMSRAELEALSPLFDWDAYFAGVGLPDRLSLNVTTPEFFGTMNAELKKDSLANWKAYLRWRLIHANAPYLSTPFVNAEFGFYGRTLQGAQEIEPRWKRCVNYVDNDLGEALGQAYVERSFSPEAKQRALRMVRQIESAMQSDIESLPWMTEETKKHALEKLHAIANKIGYPDKWRDYSTLAISRDDELGNVLRAREFEFHRQLSKIGKPVDRGEWSMTPPTVNAYYDAQLNDINFPAGILQPPVFDPSSDDAPNYGDTGGTIGHELTHGFDDEGRQFDAQGNLRDWWTPDDAKQFEKRASCISDQYSQYTAVDHIKVNGKLTLGEDVADLGGLILAYMAWQDQTRGQKLEQKPEPIEGLTAGQRFFIGYGQSWCTNTRAETKRLRATADAHSPEQYRANGVVSNMPEFQQAFHCKPESPMVRKDRCRVW
jgi:endothelin-converting enzyme/putative endopeptidase